jgi:choline-phosphate cytidylyltransferase
MKKVITYGTFDLLHYGHIKLLERAKALGDYLIVGITSDDFDRTRGKINVQQSLNERIKAVQETGLADQIIVEEYEGQKIDDILKNDVDIFTVGSDWKGHFDYLEEYCKVVYLDRTKGVSSSEIRSEKRSVRLGILGDSSLVYKYYKESSFVNGIQMVGICTCKESVKKKFKYEKCDIIDSYDELLNKCDAVYIVSAPERHYEDIKKALYAGKHVLCESPLTINLNEVKELLDYAEQHKLVLFDGIKTAYSTAYNRLLLLLKSGKIGDIISVDTTCTSLEDLNEYGSVSNEMTNSMCAWAPTGLLPIFQILGNEYVNHSIVSFNLKKNWDGFSRISFIYNDAVASTKVGKMVKSEGDMVITGTLGYVYIPAPWWKTDYFEIRYEDSRKNMRYFYQLDGEGIRNELVCFIRAIITGKDYSKIDRECSEMIVSLVDNYYSNENTIALKKWRKAE